jgi:TetR/AcrR family transcriptional regulator of autoinduction and epiphytic fitness
MPVNRIEKAAATRRRVLDQARVLFLEQGYAATTTRQIAAQAGVTERTLFNLVATKSDLLREVLKAYVFSEDYGPLLERADFEAIVQAPTVTAFLDTFAGWVTRLHQHTSAVAEMTRAAAGVDAGAAEIWSWGNEQQINDLVNLATELRRRGWLRADITVADAARSYAALAGHEGYWRLVVEQRWPVQRYQDWLRRHCAVELATP